MPRKTKPTPKPKPAKKAGRGKVKPFIENVECWALLAKDSSIVSVSDSELLMEAEMRDNYEAGEVRIITGLFIAYPL